MPLPVTGVFDPPDNYQFPLTSFTLNHVNTDGSLGTVVATSPKKDYCITGDTHVGGVPNTPNSSFIPQNNCTDPTKPLGWSVGSYTFAWTVGSTTPGSHTLSARATDSNGNMATAAPVTVTVPTSGGGGGGGPAPTVDKSVTVTGRGAVTTQTFSTTPAGETLVAFVGSDGPSGGGRQTVTVSGGGLTGRW